MLYDLKYSFKDKGSNHTWLFLPGWAMDSRIFEKIHCHDNLILIDQLDPYHFSSQLESLLSKYSITNFSIFGFSLGGFQAASFLEKSKKRVEKLVLCGVQQHYDLSIINSIKNNLHSNKSKTLSHFFRQCFQNKKDYLRFLMQLEPYFIQQFDTPYLLAHLDTLVEHPISILDGNNSLFIHGDHDAISPLILAKKLSNKLKAPLHIIQKEGHYVFFNSSVNLLIEQFLK